MQEISPDIITDVDYRAILDAEPHHTHIIVKDSRGVLRWKANPKVNEVVDRMDLNDLTHLLCRMGYGKNSEVYRKLYRDMGVSLSMYYDVFYWEVNNEDANDYKPNAK